MVNNDSKSITANEISKFVYCPYQWYYERFYGTIYIRALYKERNQRLGLTDTTYSNFKKGQEFHNAYGQTGPVGLGLKLLKWVSRFIAIVAGIVCGYLFYRYFM